jgi:2-methylcitrate dehydratase PrpD
MTDMLTARLAEFVTGTDTNALPDALLSLAQAPLTDTIGVTLAGVPEEGATIAREWVAEIGARPVARVLGTDVATSAAEAAFANGIAAHALDFDDSLPSMRGHPSATLVPVVLAVGEATRASGHEVLAAYLVALEIGGKLGRAIGQKHYLHGWHSTATVGAFTATTAAARLWKLSADQLAVAWGIAASMTGGLVRNFGSMTKPFHPGQAARTGIVAADMARRSFTADPAIFDGDGGFLGVYGFGDGEPLESLLPLLGKPWEIERPGVYVKGWPCCYCNHRPVGGLLRLRDAHGIEVGDIEEIAVGFVPGSDRALIKDNPQTGLEAKFSIEYAAAATMLDGTLALSSFTEEQVHRPEVRALMSRVRRYQVPAEGIFSGVVGFTDVSIRTKRGTFETRVDTVPGSPDWPLSAEDRRAKFLDCAAIALGPDRAEKLLAIAERTASLPDIGELLDAATKGSAAHRSTAKESRLAAAGSAL